MRRLSLGLSLLLLPALLILGCSTNTKKEESKPKKDAASSKDGTPDTEKGERTELKHKGWGSFKGKVVYDGEAPKEEAKTAELQKAMKNHKDSKVCLDGSERETEPQDWLVSDKGGISDVLVFLKPVGNHYFPIKDEDKKSDKKVVLDQPHCMFIPHVVSLYPVYFDGSKKIKTGEQFIVKNSAPMSHNTRVNGTPLLGNTANLTLPSGDEQQVNLKPEKNRAIPISCDVHPWMKAYAWVFDHPYHAVTDKDGNFEIKHVPAGAEVEVVLWHANEFVTNSDYNGENGRKMTFKADDPNETTIKLKKQ